MHNADELDHEIAIIGMSGRFPGSNSVEGFWRNLQDGVESISFFSDQELVSSGLDPAMLTKPTYVKANGLLDDVELFDASFFGFNPREAEITDPQHRLFLECAWEALESAGYNSQTYNASIGVYAGAGMNTYLLFNLYANRDLLEAVGNFQVMIGSDKDYLTTRVSYKLDLKGPSVTVQTACSTSLVAVHLACQSLLNGECDMALAGGVSIKVPQKVGYFYREGGIVSPDGRCRAFDAKAQGTVSGNGVGVVVLKRLADALREGDYIHAIIKGSAINNDGSLKVGYTAPSVDGQAEVIAQALAMARIGPETVTYVEAHGTGTSLGDPVEIAALTQAFQLGTEGRGFCAIGSVKTNIGHLDAASGIAGLIKTTLALEHHMLPPSLHFEQPNPRIDFANSPFYVNTMLSKWEPGRTPLRAGVSSFGIGGTNAHVVLEESLPNQSSGKSRPWQVLVLSAKTSSALETATTNLIGYLKQHPDLNLADVAYTLQVGRRAFNHRRMLVCRDLDDAVSALETLDPKRVSTLAHEYPEPPVVFMFPGQGTQYVNMTLELYQTETTFRGQVDLCSELLEPLLGLDLRAVLYPSEEQTEEAKQRLNQTYITQPALFVIEYALVKLWMEWGVHPQAMVGHSIGEYVAACLAGVFSLEDALALVAVRGRLIQGLPRGAMLAVPLPEKEMHPFLGKELSLAALNGPSLCVVSGPTDAIAALRNQFAERDIDCHHLQTSHAFHSAMMEPILEAFTEQVKQVNLKPPQIPYLSNVTGTWITPLEATDPNYWTKHLRQTVRFAENLRELLRDANETLLEVGPGWTLSSLARQHPDKGAERVVLPSLRHPRDHVSDEVFLLNALGKLWLSGVQVDWSGFYAHEQRHRIPLPTYPFERQRYWVDPQEQARKDSDPQTGSGKISSTIADLNTDVSSSLHPRPELSTAYVAPRNQIEQGLAAIWQDLLGIELVGVHDNFFDLGGHSLLATQLMSRVRDILQVEVPLHIIFESSSVASLVEHIEAVRWPKQNRSAPLLQPMPRVSDLPLSFAQERLWFFDQLEPRNPVYNIADAVQLMGPLHVAALQQSLQEIIRRHEALRTTFTAIDGRPVQIIAPDLNLPLSIVDLRALPESERKAEAIRLATEEARQSFDLACGPLVRATLLRLDAEDHVLLLTLHHIVSDGWSMGVLAREVMVLYEAYSGGHASRLPELPIQYADYALWQRMWLQGEMLEEQLTYWQEQLAGIPVLELPTDRARPARQTFHGASYAFTLSIALTEALKELSRQENVTLFMTLLAAFNVLLYRYTRQDDMAVGTPIANRTRSDLEGLIGLFVNTLVLRTHLSGNPSFRDLMGRVRNVALEAYAHQDLPFEQLVQALQPQRDLSHPPLFQVMFVLQNAPIEILELADLRLSRLEVDNGTAKFDLTLDLFERPEGLSGYFEYNTGLFEPTTISRLVGHFQTLLEGIAADPEQRLADLQLLTAAERHQLLVNWNATHAEYPKAVCVQEMFEAQVERTPEAVAAVYEGKQLTYRELNCCANQLAHFMRLLRVEPEVRVGICMERSLEMIVGLLGILKAGGAYIPLDPDYPSERLAFMLEDAQVPVLLTQSHLLPKLSKSEAKVVCLDSDWGVIAQQSTQNPISGVGVNNLAYVIYTSGSTGKPKGTMIPHQGLTNYLTWCTTSYAVAEGRGSVVHSSIAFDLTITSLFSPLLVGKSIVLLPDGLEGEALGTTLQNGGDFSIVKITPAHLGMLTQQLLSEEAGRWTRALVIGGEALRGETLTFWQTHAPKTRLFNEYGPTETVVGCCVYEIPAGTSISGVVPIGRPIGNTRLYILDGHLHTTPIGVPGELYIGGAGVARGYLNHPELTAEGFIPDPFSEEPGARLYKTGDLARYLPDGIVEFLGRLDHQVKVRGFRIELSEIEAVLTQHPAVQEAVVIAQENVPGDKRLVAYVVSPQALTSRTDELQRFLRTKLPNYMVPAAIVVLEALPLTQNGKVDRQALPVPDQVRPELAEGYVAPRTTTEERLANIWAQVLGIERVGIHDNFFDLGGHSLLATQLIFRLRDAFQVELPLRTLFEIPTVAAMAQTIDTVLRAGPSAMDTMTLIDLRTEAVLDPAISPESMLVEYVAEPACIFLTGAAGFLGTFLLHEFLQQTRADIYCLVRSPSVEEGRKRLQRGLEAYSLQKEYPSSRIIPVIGDLSQPLFGLSTHHFRALASKIDVIYHNGALVNFIYPYHELKAANVLGTQEILRLASQTKTKPVHYVSTLNVFSPVDYPEMQLVREQESLDYSGKGPHSGYAQSKWVAEKLVAIAGSRGLPVCIYRPGRITGHSQTGVWNTDDFLCRVIKGCIQLGCVPDTNEMLDMTPVDYVSKAIIYLSRQKTSLGKAFHLINPHLISVKELVNWANTFGYPLQRTSYEKWREELINITKRSQENALYALLPLFAAREHEDQQSVQEQYLQPRRVQFDCQNTIDGLAGSSLVCPPVDSKLLSTYFSFFIRTGFLDAPQPSGEL